MGADTKKDKWETCPFFGGKGREGKENGRRRKGRKKRVSGLRSVCMYGMHGAPTPNGRGSDCSLVALPRKSTYYIATKVEKDTIKGQCSLFHCLHARPAASSQGTATKFVKQNTCVIHVLMRSIAVNGRFFSLQFCYAFVLPFCNPHSVQYSERTP